MRTRDWVSVVLGGFGSAFAVLAVGGAFRWTQAVVAACMALALIAQLPSRRVFARRSPLIVVLLVAAGLTTISLLPLPSALREILDPVGSALRDDGAALMDLHPWPALTHDVPGSLRALIFFATLLGLAVICLRIGASDRGRYRLAAFVSALCALTAWVTIAHVCFGATRLYGFYEKQASPNVLGPLLNQNHLGGLMALGTCISMGLLMFPRQRSSVRALWMTNVLACGAITAASGSRGALIAVAAGGALCISLIMAQRFTSEQRTRRRSRFMTSSLPLGLVGGCIVVIVVYSSAGSVSTKFGATTMSEVNQPRSKFATWKSAEQLVRESPWVGIGRGGLEPSLTRVNPSSGALTVAYLENEYIQAIVDWGIPGALLFALAMFWFIGKAAGKWRDGPLAAGALGGVFAIAIQSNVDYGVELLGVAVPVTIVASMLSYVPLREESAKRLTLARGVRVIHAVCLIAGGVLLLCPATSSLAEDHRRFVKTTPALDAVRESLDHHPMDYFGYAIASQLVRDGKSVPLLNHSMRLNPMHPDLHRRAAHLLLRAGHEGQAAIEFADAVRASPQPDEVIAEIVKTFPPDRAAEALPFDYPNVDRIIGILQELKHPEVGTRWLARLLQLRPKDLHVCNLLYELSLGSGDLDAAEIAGRSCVELLPDQQTRFSLASLLMKREKYDDAIKMLGDVSSWHGLKSERAKAWLLLCDAKIALSRFDDAASCLHRLDAVGDANDQVHEEIRTRLESVRTHQSPASGTH